MIQRSQLQSAFFCMNPPKMHKEPHDSMIMQKQTKKLEHQETLQLASFCTQRERPCSYPSFELVEREMTCNCPVYALAELSHSEIEK